MWCGARNGRAGAAAPTRSPATDLDPRDLERLRRRERRQDRRQPAREHRLAGAGGPQQDVVAAGGGDDQRSRSARRGPRTSARSDASSGSAGAARASRGRGASSPRSTAATSARSPAPPTTIARRSPPRRRAPRHDQPSRPAAARPPRRPAPRAGPDLAVRARARRRPRAAPAARRHLVARGQDAAGDRQVEPRALLSQVGRGEVDRDAALREREARVEDRAADALARLAHGAVPEADDRERRSPWRTSTSTVTRRVRCRRWRTW